MTDLMYKHQIQQLIREVYGRLDREGAPPRSVQPYAPDRLAALPAAAARWAFGTGDPVAHADLARGETVVDLGCGAGPDVVLAARAVGPTGHVVGVDLLPEMCRRAQRNAATAGMSVDVVEAEAEALPLRDGSVDAVVTNGVVSLSARKARLFAEARRVLRPGGRLVVADMTLDEEDLPTEVLVHPSAWAG